MDSDVSFDPEFLGIPGFEKSELPYKERIVKVNEFRNELAIHEASHFVFHQLLSKNLTDSYFIGHAVICTDNIKLNEVNFKPSPYYKKYGIHLYFIDDRRRLVVHLLNLIAGYSSHQEFISSEKFYIFSEVSHPENGTLKVKYCSLENHRFCCTDDFGRINELLRDYYSNPDYVERIKILKRLTSLAQSIMRNEQVNKCIHLVKDALLKSECKKIEGDELETLKKSVNELISDLDFTGILEELKDEIKY